MFKKINLLITQLIGSFVVGAILITNTAIAAQPVIYEFSQPMCSACRQLKQVLPSVESKYAGKVIIKKINTSSSDSNTRALMSKYGVRAVPTLVFIDKNGNVVKKTTGVVSKSQLNSYFKQIAK